MSDAHRDARRAARGPARLPVRAQLPRGRRAAPGARRRGRGRAGGVLARRADVVVPVAQRHPAGPRRRAFAASRPTSSGFGRSDKPIDIDWYSYDRHTDMAATLLEDLDLRDATFVVHDWGGPIGLRIAVEHPDRMSRIVILDTGLFTGSQRMSDAWRAFRDFVERTEDLPISLPRATAPAKRVPVDEVDGGLRRAVPDVASQGRRARLPADDPARARRARAPPRASACWRRCAADDAADALPVGRPGPDPPARRRRALRRGDRRTRASPRDPRGAATSSRRTRAR